MNKTFCKVLMLFVMPLFIIFRSACDYKCSRLIFDGTGGTAVETITQDFGTAVSKPSDPTKEANQFVDWYTDPKPPLGSKTGLAYDHFKKITVASNGDPSMTPQLFLDGLFN